jgi:carboxylesterase type B
LPLYFSPTNENADDSDEEAFLPDIPTNIIAQGRVHKLAFIIGVTSAEGIFLLKGKKEDLREGLQTFTFLCDVYRKK